LPIDLEMVGTRGLSRIARRLGSSMTSTPPVHLNNRHRDTLEQIFAHPASHNIEWPAVLSLLEALGSVELRHDGKFVVSLGAETETFERPKGKDIDAQQVVDLRRMLSNTGYGPTATKREVGHNGRRSAGERQAHSETLRGKQVIAAVDFHQTVIYATDAAPGQPPTKLLSSDPRGYFHKVSHHAGNPDGTYEADSTDYWQEVSDALSPAGEILLLSHGKGKANASLHFLAYAENHRKDVAAKIVADVRADIDDLTGEQVLRWAQRYFGEAPGRDAGDDRRGAPQDSPSN